MIAPALALLAAASLAQGTQQYIGNGAPRFEAAPALAYVRIACIGDSITEEGFEESSYCALTESALRLPYRSTNFGVAGYQTAAMVTKWTNSVRNQGFHIVTFLGGINDLGSSQNIAVDTDNAYNNAVTIISQAKADGLDVYVLLVLPYKGNNSWTSARQAAVDDYNSRLVAYCAAQTHVTCVDTYSDLEDDAVPDTLQEQYLREEPAVDWLHINQTGRARIATLLTAAITAGPDP
jgi:lysophospholipase L1-like esterase